MKGKLFFVATPIGNLKDISLRAIETLQFCDEILCEDTRESLKLLSHLNIKKPLLSYHKFNFKKQNDVVLQKLMNGKNLALITDAGTPAISDPGTELINTLMQNKIEYTIIPGASAFLNAFVLSGFSSPFTFVGFLPEKNTEKQKLIDELKFYKSTLIFYCAPHNLNEFLKYLFENLQNRKICIVRELTKKFEEVMFLNLKDEYMGKLKGEFVVIVQGNTENEELNNLSIIDHFNYYFNLGNTKNESIKLVAKDRRIAKNEIYKLIVKD